MDSRRTNIFGHLDYQIKVTATFTPTRSCPTPVRLGIIRTEQTRSGSGTEPGGTGNGSIGIGSGRSGGFPAGVPIVYEEQSHRRTRVVLPPAVSVTDFNLILRMEFLPPVTYPGGPVRSVPGLPGDRSGSTVH